MSLDLLFVTVFVGVADEGCVTEDEAFWKSSFITACLISERFAGAFLDFVAFLDEPNPSVQNA